MESNNNSYGISRTRQTQSDTDRATSRTVRSSSTNPEVEQVGTPIGNQHFVSTSNVGGGSGGAGLAGIEIVWADQTESFILASDLLDGYDGEDYWSLVLTVNSGVFDKTTTYDATEALFEDDGGTPVSQTKYRMRLITNYLNSDGDNTSSSISMYGQYREVTTCINGEPFQRLAKVT